MVWAPEGEIFSPTTPALRVKTLFSMNPLKQYSTLQDTGQDWRLQYLTDQSTPHVLSVCKGREKGDLFPHTQLGTESKGKEASGFPEEKEPKFLWHCLIKWVLLQKKTFEKFPIQCTPWYHYFKSFKTSKAIWHLAVPGVLTVRLISWYNNFLENHLNYTRPCSV